MVLTFAKYNPAFLSDEELISSFVVREKELELVLETISNNSGKSNQHLLLIGPRGIGKTMLIRRAAIAVQRDKELNEKWCPIIFGEESYKVFTAGEFWLEAIFHLKKQTNLEKWANIYDSLKKEHNHEHLCSLALDRLLDFAKKSNKRLLLLVENLQLIFGEQFDKREAWVLRHTLINEPDIMLIGTSTTRFSQLDFQSEAFYDMFKITKLEPLETAECRKIWYFMTREELPDEKIRPVQIITGGNPRLLAVVATFAKGKAFQLLMDDLVQLVDDHTDYLKSNIESLAPLERKIYVTLLEKWDPATAREIALEARENVNKTSSLLNRLVDKGAVMVFEEKPRLKTYQAAERMYNIYYLMRHSGNRESRVHAAVRFMVTFYQEEELVSLVKGIAVEACNMNLQSGTDHIAAYKALLDQISDPDLKYKIVRETPEQFRQIPEIAQKIEKFSEYLKTTKDLETIEKLSEINVETSKEVTSLLDYGSELEKISKNYKEAEKIYRKAIKLDPKNYKVRIYIGELYDKQDRLVYAEKAYRKAIELEPESARAWALLGKLLHVKLGRYEEAEKAYRKVIELKPGIVYSWVLLGLLLHEKLGRYEEAEKAYKKAIDLEPDVTFSWALLGLLLHEKLGRYKEAEKAYRKAIDLEPDVFFGWAHLGQLLHEKLGNYEEAEKAYKKAIELEPEYAWAWAHLGQLLHEKLGRYEEAEKAYRKTIELNTESAWAWAQLGLLLHEKLGRYEEAEKAYRKSIELKSEHAGVWFLLGLLLHEKLGHYEEAEKAYIKALEIKPDLAIGWYFLGILRMEKLNKQEEAEYSFRKAIDLMPGVFNYWSCLIDLIRKNKARKNEVFKIAQKYLEKNDYSLESLQNISYKLFKLGNKSFLIFAENCAHQAKDKFPEDNEAGLILSLILGALAKWDEAFETCPTSLNDKEVVEKYKRDLINFLIKAASAGKSQEALRILTDSQAASLLEPLVVALRMDLGEKVLVAQEIKEVAEDVLKKIEKGRQKKGNHKGKKK